jgi:hypothetical protein
MNLSSINHLHEKKEVFGIHFADLTTKSLPEGNKSNSRFIGQRLIG